MRMSEIRSRLDRRDAASLAEWMRGTLAAQGTEARAEGEKRYLKSEAEFLGATMPQIRHAVSALLGKHPDLSREELLSLVETLWATGIHECRMAAALLLNRRQELLRAEDLDLVERMLRTAGTWALVDTIAPFTGAALVARLADCDAVVRRWGSDADFWIRRSALLIHLKGARDDPVTFERFAELADGMLSEKEFFIRKAIGWVLREVSKHRPDAVEEWLRPRADRVSGVTIREAVKYLSAHAAGEIMEAYREGRPAA